MARRKPNDGQLGFELPELPGMNPNHLPPFSTYAPPRRTAEQERSVRAGRYTGAYPEYHPELDGPPPIPPLDNVYGAGGEPPNKSPAPPASDEPEDDDDGEPDFSEPEDSGEDSPVERRGQPRMVANEQSLAAGMALADEGIERAAEHAGDAWREAAYKAGVRVATLQGEFTTDEIWRILSDAQGNEWQPDGDPRAMGSIIRRLKRDAVIVDTGRTTNTKRRSAHGSTIPVYRSLVLQGN